MTSESRPGYHLVFTMTIRRNGRIYRRRNGRPYVFWAKD